MNATRELIVVFLTGVESNLAEILSNNKGKDVTGERIVSKLKDRAVELRDHFANGAPQGLQPNDAELVRRFALALEDAKSACATKHLAEDLQFQSDGIHAFLMEAGAQPVDGGWKFVN